MNKAPNFLICDWETGGFESKIHAVTEFAGIILNPITLEEVDRFECIIAPYSDDLLYTPEALIKTNMTIEQIKNGVDFKTFSRNFQQFLKKSNFYTHKKYRTIVVGHNITFDAGFFQQVFSYMRKKMSDYLATYEDFHGNEQLKYLDTLTLSMTKWASDETMQTHTLSDCVGKIGEEIVNAHRAMNDVVATKNLFIHFLKLLQNKSGNQNISVAEIESRFREQFKF